MMTEEISEMNKVLSDFPEDDVVDLVDEVDEETDDAQDGESDSDDQSTDAEAAEAQEEDDEAASDEDGSDPRDAIIEQLRERLEKLENASNEADASEADAEAEPDQDEPIDFLGDAEIDDVFDNKDGLNGFLNDFRKRVADDVRRKTVEEVIRSIPEVVRYNIQVMNSLQQARDDFYSANEDLKPFKKVVAQVFEEISSSNPGKEYSELLELTAPEVRKRLDLESKAKKPEKQKAAPNLPRKRGKAGRPAEQPKPSGLEAELEAMNKVMKEI